MLHGKGLVYTGCETICRTERSFEGGTQLTMAVTQIVDGYRPPVWPTDLNDFVVLLPRMFRRPEGSQSRCYPR